MSEGRAVGAAGPFLNSALREELEISKQIRSETAIGKLAVSIPIAALELARQIFGTLDNRPVLLLGGDRRNVRALGSPHPAHAAGSVVVTDQLPARARELAEELGGRWVTIADRRTCMLNADIVIAATGCPHVLLTCDEAEGIARERNRVALVIMDIGIPRDVDPEVHRVDGIMLYDLAGLERATQPPTQDRMAASEEAERIVAVEAQELLVQTALVGR